MITKEQAFGMYIGQKFTCKDITQGYLIGVFAERAIVDTNDEGWEVVFQCISDDNDCGSYPLPDCKLILRPFESITAVEVEKLQQMYEDIKYKVTKPIEFKTGSCLNIYAIDIAMIEYLISIGIDLFDLKSRGWAVYEGKGK